jgi:hypothetical protein
MYPGVTRAALELRVDHAVVDGQPFEACLRFLPSDAASRSHRMKPRQSTEISMQSMSTSSGQWITILVEHLAPKAQVSFAHDPAWRIEQAIRIGPACAELINSRQAIESKLAYTEFLALLIQDEVARREQKSSSCPSAAPPSGQAKPSSNSTSSVFRRSTARTCRIRPPAAISASEHPCSSLALAAPEIPYRPGARSLCCAPGHRLMFTRAPAHRQPQCRPRHRRLRPQAPEPRAFAAADHRCDVSHPRSVLVAGSPQPSSATNHKRVADLMLRRHSGSHRRRTRRTRCFNIPASQADSP